MAFAHVRVLARRRRRSACERASGARCGVVAAQIPFAEDCSAAYYCAFDRATPLPVKATLVGALAYFVLPLDAIPDVLPVLGFTDDAAVLATAIKLVASHIRPEHRDGARSKLAEYRIAVAAARRATSYGRKITLPITLPRGDRLERGRRLRPADRPRARATTICLPRTSP